MPPRRRTATRKTTTSRTPKPAPVAPVVGHGERLFVLSVPFEERGVANANGSRWDPYTRQNIYVGANLPYGLTPYASPDHSWERWVEDDLNGNVLPTQPSGLTLTPRPHQVEAINKIEATAARGYRGFVEADDVGLGKTIASWLGAMKVAQARGGTKILVMCPKGVIPHWRRTIAALGTQGTRVVVINYDQAKKLLTIPESAADAKRTRTKNKRIATSGQPLVNWDLILFDESHKTKNQESQRSKAAARIARYSEAARTAPFVVWMSATIGQSPSELGYLWPLLAQITGATKSDLKDFGQWLADQGFYVTYNARFEKWDWGVIPDEAAPAEVAQIEAAKERDLAKIRELIFDGPDAPSIRRLPTDIAGWPEIQRIPFPVALDRDQRRLYDQAWTAFRADMRLFAKGRDPKGGMAARLRFRQKASLIRVPGTVDHILDLLDNGHQVAVSVEFHETSDAIREALEKSKVRVAEFSGRNTATREQERIAFQRGQRDVMLFSVLEGISLHQKEQLEDGTLASDVPRTTVIHDPRYSGLEAIQVEGRAHRDGQASNAYYAYAAGTVEEKIVRTLVGRVRSTKAMSGDDVSSVEALETLLEAEALNDETPDPASSAATSALPRPGTAPSAVRPPQSTVAPPNRTVRPARTVPETTAGRQTSPSPAPNNTRGKGTSSRRVSRPAAPTADGSMSAEERALREALSGGKKTTPKRPATESDRRAFEDRLKRG